MPLEPYHLKSCWAGAKRIGWRWMLWAVVAAFVPALVLLPVVVLVGAVIGDAVLLVASTIQKDIEAGRLDAEERRKKKAAEREAERRSQAERARIAAIPPPPTLKEKVMALKRKLQDRLEAIDELPLEDDEKADLKEDENGRFLDQVQDLLE